MRLINIEVTSDLTEIARLREELRVVACVRIPELLNPSLVDFLLWLARPWPSKLL